MFGKVKNQKKEFYKKREERMKKLDIYEQRIKETDEFLKNDKQANKNIDDMIKAMDDYFQSLA